MDHKFSHTFPDDCAIPQLRGQTFTGGRLCKLPDGADGVDFGAHFGKRIMARIAGKPELEDQLAAHHAADAKRDAILIAIGWPAYSALRSKAINARYAYDRASERGYPVRQAMAMRAADEALAQAAQQYPGAALYGRADGYSMSSNYAKAGAGRAAMAEIEAGGDPGAAIAAMEAAWSADAERMVANA